ncbi:alpha/beta hydrolase [Streptomyces kunmingensis]|uniref:Alpha/beta hydrolase n=1 Tax=Streptomyces kunmingensis TaxID=68225 RepID=A0ABU6CN74_9ACTN|nr:alpha/beta fold hydrolase [Streptomyces kunmingensis]MEB3966142.1 alpha/beta hydrolase [Streptomyces kunmingensis]
MTEFVLVPGLFTGPRVWRATAELLTARGANTHIVDLGPAADLETHIARVVETVDAIGAAAGERDIVLVGHDYGMHPAVGAADRRANRVARIVYVDTAPAQDGAPALTSLANHEVRERLTAAGDRTGELPPPTRKEWQHWGSTAGLSDDDLDLLTASATAQPLGTLVQPLRLTGGPDPLPSTAVLCTESGATIAAVRMLMNFGDPVLKALARPDVTFFELPTGHWPMLSCPGELADVLLAAAAGEGTGLMTPEEEPEHPGYMRPFLFDVPHIPRERHGTIDLYVPEGVEAAPRPAIVFVHGGPVPAGVRPTPRDWTTFVSYGRYAADRGVIGVTLDHALHDVSAYPTAAGDLAAAVAQVRADPRVDAERIALWFFSGSGPMTAPWLSEPPTWLRCLAACYPIMSPLPGWGVNDPRFRPAEVVARGSDVPFVLVRAGLETSAIAATVAEFVTAAEAGGAPLEVLDVPDGHHGFEGLDHTDDARRAVREAMGRVLERLGRG